MLKVETERLGIFSPYGVCIPCNLYISDHRGAATELCSFCDMNRSRRLNEDEPGRPLD